MRVVEGLGGQFNGREDAVMDELKINTRGSVTKTLNSQKRCHVGSSGEAGDDIGGSMQ